ncbi:acyl-CoA dehydrogenase C-terminal domain-containing protein [Nocardia asteroides]|uniref:acyl-CoA dehydrogenase C-terminal domain-containing protein n=1 Tax=Nocardia asteroides TaxID=1824 RepID=UPI0037CA8A30
MEAATSAAWVTLGGDEYHQRTRRKPEGRRPDQVARDHGVALPHLADQIRATAQPEIGGEELESERARLLTALEDVQAMAGLLTEHLLSAGENPRALYKIGLESVRFLMAVGDLLIGWRLLVAAEVATATPVSGGSDQELAFYEGKVAVASYFIRVVLPRLSADRTVLADIDESIMSLDEAAF